MSSSSSDSFESSFNTIVVASIVSSIVGTIALVAIVIAIVKCLGKAGKAISTDNLPQTANNLLMSLPQPKPSAAVVPMPQPVPVTLRPSQQHQINEATIDKIISDMARQKPVRFSSHQLASFTNNYSTKLGSGGFGVVYKGWLTDVLPVAIKVLNENLDKKAEGQFLAEVRTIGRTNHVNLVRLCGFCFDAMTKALVYEYMENGSLDKFLFSKTQKIEWEKLNAIAIGTAKGIAYLHEGCREKIIHCDIKPGNVLLDANFSPKVADFGLAKLCSSDRTQFTKTAFRGTPGYAAPEMWMPFPTTRKCDVYSYGMMLFEILGNRRNLDVNLASSQEWFPRLVWEKFDKRELLGVISLCGIEEKHREQAERMSMVALWCVQYQPNERPKMSDVVKMLEDGSEIATPPNPFQHLMSSGKAFDVWSESNADSTTTAKTVKICMRNSTPIMRKYEIEMASSTQH